MKQLHTSTPQKPTRKGNLRRPQQQLRELALTEADGFADLMALVRHFSETQLGTPLNDGKCREKTAALLGYPKHSLFRKDYKAKHALRATIDKLKLEELRLTLDETHRNNKSMYQVLIIRPNNHINDQLCEVYLEWTKRLREAMGRRDIQADAEAMADYLSQLCGVTPRVRITETQRFEQCNPEQLAMDHIRRHGLFLSPRNQGEERLEHNSETDYKVAISPSAVFLHQSDAFFGRWRDEHNKTWKLRIHATPDNVLTLSTLKIALNQIHLLCPALEQCYLLPEQLPEMLTRFLEGEPKSLTLHYTVPEHGQAPNPVVLDIGSEVMNFSNNFKGGVWGNVNIEPQPLPVNTGHPLWEEAHIQPDYPILD
ncbi:hypothetical protein [Vibrio alginolyticus]|uniref:hypothetical protein n=1 Tax=Vibrio alginolyticus TaxID=663 RepID=UPI0006CA9198|nr:hypothetical protein [Vibrio alginolyticus]ELH9636994.1 hypothetical protein [Vibrio alginolyticus]KPM93911.1 hypothetical protein AOR10_05580 [Vibrio alginolyticus]